jgi:hypothetical protein
VTGGTSEIDETAICQKNNMSTRGQKVAVDLGLDVGDGLGVGLEPGNINLNIEMSNVYLVSKV